MTEKLLRDSVRGTVSLSHVLFPVFEHQDMDDLAFFTDAEIGLMIVKIDQFKENPRGLSGGGQILTALQVIETCKEKLLEKVQFLHEALVPKERVVRKVNVADIIESEHEKMITNVAYGFKLLTEKILRDVARAQLGDIEENYTRDELPCVLATKQITGKLLPPGE